MTTSQNKEKQSVVVSGDNMHAKHHCEVLIMNRDADGPGGAGNYYNSLGVVDDVPDEEFDARFRALDPEKLRQEYGGDAVRFNGPRRFLADRFTAEAFDGGKVSMVGPIPMYLYGTFVVPDFDAFIAGKQTPYARRSPSAPPHGSSRPAPRCTSWSPPRESCSSCRAPR